MAGFLEKIMNRTNFFDLDNGFGEKQKTRRKEIQKKQNEIDKLKVKNNDGLAEYKRKMLENGYVSFAGLEGGRWYSRLPDDIRAENPEILKVYRELRQAHTEAMQNLFDFYGTDEFVEFCKVLHEKHPRVADRLKVSPHSYSWRGKKLADIRR